MIKTLEFIKNNPDWRKLLTSAPYCLKIDEKSINGKDYILFKYDQIDSDLSNDIVKECRGIIFRMSDWKVVCFPFKKFFNYGEINADQIDFSTAKVQEKVDGSIIKLWNDNNKWIISTNGKIDAEEPTCAIGRTFKDLFIESLKNHFDNEEKYIEFFDLINSHLKNGKNYTYIFEMVHPLARVVIPYDKPDVRHIGTRDNDTHEELDIDLRVKKPMEYKFNSFDDVLEMSKTLPYNEEGYVVVDGNWNRVKVKSPAYLAVHHLKNNGVLSARRVMDIVLKGEQSEVLALFPEFTEYFDAATKTFTEFKYNLIKDIIEIRNLKFETRKDFAMKVSRTKLPAFFFQVYDGKYSYDDLSKYLNEVMGGEKVANLLKLKDKLLKI